MRISALDSSLLQQRDIIDRLLFSIEPYDGSAADLIMTLGSKKACVFRLPKAAELFNDKKADRLLLCGGRVQKTPLGIMPEYLSMLKAAQPLGIDKGCIITEKFSLNTSQNFSFSKPIIKRKLPHCRRIILVTAAFHMRRALLIGRRIMPEYQLIPCCGRDNSTRRDNWFLSQKGISRCLGEAQKLVSLAKSGGIEDIEI